MADSYQQLFALGWRLSDEGLTACIQQCQDMGLEVTAATLHAIALDLDLRQIGAPSIREEVWRGLPVELHGPLILQIQRVRNVALPPSTPPSSTPPRRLLRLQFTDGHVSVGGLEVGGEVGGVGPLTPPGTKVKLVGCVRAQNRFLLLDSSSLVKLGGRVEALEQKWALQMVVPTNLVRDRGDGSGPPPFEPFRKKPTPSGVRRGGGHHSSKELTAQTPTPSGVRRGGGHHSSKELTAQTPTPSGIRRGGGHHSSSDAKRGEGSSSAQQVTRTAQPRVSQRTEQRQTSLYQDKRVLRGLNPHEGQSTMKQVYPHPSEMESEEGTRRPRESHQLSDWFDQKLMLGKKSEERDLHCAEEQVAVSGRGRGGRQSWGQRSEEVALGVDRRRGRGRGRVAEHNREHQRFNEEELDRASGQRPVSRDFRHLATSQEATKNVGTSDGQYNWGWVSKGVPGGAMKK